MKVMQINAIGNLYSTGRNCMEISKICNETGIICFNAFPYGSKIGNKDILIGNKIDHKIHGLFSRLFGLQGYYSKDATRRLIDKIENENIDVVSLNNLHGNYINLELLFNFLAKKNIATVITLHDCWFYTGKCTHYSSIGCYKWKTGCQKCPKLKEDNKSFLFDRTKKIWNDKLLWLQSIPNLSVVGVSNWIIEEAKKSPFFKNARFISIYNWIDLKIFKPLSNATFKNKYGIKNKKVFLGVATKWSEKKGLNHFVNLSKVLYEDECIVLVGNVASTKLPQNIISIPTTNDLNELVDIYNSADVFLQFSQEETFGKVVAEALACGTPVITNSETANPELVDEKCGIVLNKLCNETIRIALNKLCNKKDFTSYCRDFAEKKFDINNQIHKYIEVYKSSYCRKV